MTDRRRTDRRASSGKISVERRQADRRQGSRRSSERVPVSLWVEDQEGGNTYLLRASDLSSAGVFFAAALPPPIGTEMQLRLTLPGEETPILARGRVANVGRSEGRLGVGVAFEHFEGGGAERLRRYLAECR